MWMLGIELGFPPEDLLWTSLLLIEEETQVDFLWILQKEKTMSSWHILTSCPQLSQDGETPRSTSLAQPHLQAQQANLTAQWRLPLLSCHKASHTGLWEQSGRGCSDEQGQQQSLSPICEGKLPAKPSSMSVADPRGWTFLCTKDQRDGAPASRYYVYSGFFVLFLFLEGEERKT
jgi:hypothetical protein